MATVQSQSSGAPSQPGAQAAAQMGAAARKFLDSLTTEQKARATFEYMDGERMYWYYPPINRHGLALRDMDANQRELAFALLASGLTQRSYEQARQIIEHEDVLGPSRKRDGHDHFRARHRVVLLHNLRRARFQGALGLALRRDITSLCISAYGETTSYR